MKYSLKNLNKSIDKWVANKINLAPDKDYTEAFLKERYTDLVNNFDGFKNFIKNQHFQTTYHKYKIGDYNDLEKIFSNDDELISSYKYKIIDIAIKKELFKKIKEAITILEIKRKLDVINKENQKESSEPLQNTNEKHIGQMKINKNDEKIYFIKGGKRVMSEWDFMNKIGTIERLKEKGITINPTHNFELLKQVRQEQFEKAKQSFLAERKIDNLETSDFEMNCFYIAWLKGELKAIEQWLSDKYPDGTEKMLSKPTTSTQIELLKYKQYVIDEFEKTEKLINPLPQPETKAELKVQDKRSKKNKQLTLSEIWSDSKEAEKHNEFSLLLKKGYLKQNNDQTYEWLGKGWKNLAAITEIWKDKNLLKSNWQKFGNQRELCNAVCKQFGIAEKKIHSVYNSAFKESKISIHGQLNSDMLKIKQDIILLLAD